MVAIFAVGYVAIVLEHPLRLNKAASALLAGGMCWTVYAIEEVDRGYVNEQLYHHLGDVAQIVFFLLCAMTIVELIDAHDGFELITSRIKTRSRRKLLVIVSLVSFLLSSVLNNLTTSIVMMSLIRRLVPDDRDRRYFAGAVIIATNSGGVWSPIGDVTSTMLWVGKQVTATALITHTGIPALVSLLVPILWIGARMKGELGGPAAPPATAGSVSESALVSERPAEPTREWERLLVFAIGTGALVLLPIFSTITDLPPVMGMLLALGALWALTELIHKRKNDEIKGQLTVAGALQRVDSQSILFFLGILLAIAALQSAGYLRELAHTLDRLIGNVDAITISIGLSSSVVDNVPLVAAAQGMYSLAHFGSDHHFWLFLAYCAGTGGSILIIGSAAGVAVMGIQRITFGWYVRHMSVPALLGYLGGAAAYLLHAQF
jgi:Na+/H+ antiporter NhaD/arsenite permease-like protein